ncbi:Metallo-dependent phosphatase-like protein [Echria macrotheca]|uniref:Purple acid phosphatase n=1 Tax=Echria macrotheca TaxID=438768 RepID=A0AAJ0F741_9PEZI|nr:Metallo-dependent phosphatase-like protein [Echria macrotheca]
MRTSLPVVLLAICRVVSVVAEDDLPCSVETSPTQIRLAYWGDHGMAVSWNTKHKLARPTVWYAPDVGNHGNNDSLNKKASSDISVTYPTSSTFNNHVVIDGLAPHSSYLYRPQCGNKTYRFTTARSAGKGPSGLKFAMVGDMGTMGPDGLSTEVGTGAANPLQPGDLNTIQSLLAYAGHYDFVWHVGDIAYADSWLKEEKGGYITPLNKTDNGAVYDRILNEFYDEIEPISRSTPYMVGPGNHEANCDNGSDLSICIPGQLNFTGYRAHWKMPGSFSGGVENFWYSWENGPVHFIQFNTETDFANAPDEPGGEGAENAGPFAPSGAQLAWLEKDLAGVDRKKTPWVIVGGHRPWYVSSSPCIECRDAFEPLFLKYGVDLVLHGHKHFYEREAAVGPLGATIQEIDGNPTLPWYIVNGAGGHYDGLDTPAAHVNTSRKVIVEYGWSLFTVHNCTHLTTQFVASKNGSVLDTATLVKDRKCNVAGWN